MNIRFPVTLASILSLIRYERRRDIATTVYILIHLFTCVRCKKVIAINAKIAEYLVDLRILLSYVITRAILIKRSNGLNTVTYRSEFLDSLC